MFLIITTLIAQILACNHTPKVLISFLSPPQFPRTNHKIDLSRLVKVSFPCAAVGSVFQYSLDLISSSGAVVHVLSQGTTCAKVLDFPFDPVSDNFMFVPYGKVKKYKPSASFRIKLIVSNDESEYFGVSNSFVLQRDLYKGSGSEFFKNGDYSSDASWNMTRSYTCIATDLPDISEELKMPNNPVKIGNGNYIGI